MRAAVNVFVLSLALFGGALTLPGARASASEREEGGADRFVPSLAAFSGVLVQDWRASTESEICRECSFPDPSATMLRTGDRGGNRDIAPFVGSVLELTTPALPVFGAPRFFVGGEFAAAFGIERKVAREGSAGILGSPFQGVSAQAFPEEIATGQGSETVAQIDHFTYGAHAGVAVPVEAFGRQLRIKPSFAWIRYGVDVEGLVVDAECQPSGGGTQCNPGATTPGFLRPVILEAEESETFDGIGPGLDIEMTTGRHGPVASSLFFGARLYKILGDREVTMEAPIQSYSDPAGNDQARGRFSFEVDEWNYRIAIGLRLEWLGFED